MNILVTGATGFVGSALCRTLVAQNHTVRAIVRSQTHPLPATVQPLLTDTLTTPVPQDNLTDTEAIVYLAARVHQMKDQATDPLTAYRDINTRAATTLARTAATAGVRRFIYLSSIKVNGEGQGIDPDSRRPPYTEQSLPQPQDPYAQSKWEAEQELLKIARETGLEVVILRPPLVYGPQVKANFLQLLKIIQAGLPLPLAQVQNRRSLIYRENLTDAILTCLTHPDAANQTFLLSDGEDLSTPELIRHLAIALKTSPRLFPCPPPLLQGIAQITRKTATLDRLLGSLRIDSSKIRQTLHWQPPFTVKQGLQATADWYRNEK